jgi:hypothetical protein
MLIIFSGSVAFAQLPAKNQASGFFQVSSEQFEKTIQSNPGDLVQIQIDPTTIFKGIVVSKVQTYQNLITMVIKSTDDERSRFQLCQEITNDKKKRFSGSIIREKNGVLVRLKKQGDQYHFESIDLEKTKPVCYPRG